MYGKAKMATFERYFIRDEKLRKEQKNIYYQLIEKEEVLNRILEEFGLPTQGSHIINGHMPVQLLKGQKPVYCDGKLLIIDGGFAKAYQKETGIAGYTLVYNSYGLRLVAMNPSSPPRQPSKKRAIFILRRPSWSRYCAVEAWETPMWAGDLKSQIADLEKAAAGIPRRHDFGDGDDLSI